MYYRFLTQKLKAPLNFEIHIEQISQSKKLSGGFLTAACRSRLPPKQS
jgi:hypothetical protein